MQALTEIVVAEQHSEHMRGHQHLAVADRLGGGAVSATERRQRKVFAVAYVVGIGLELIAAIVGTAAGDLLVQVVRQVGGQAFAPVAGLVVDVDAIAPPVVQNLVGVGAVQDKWQP